MRRLIEAGANPNLFFYEGVDVLVRSTLQAEAETVQFLLEEAGVDPNHNTAPEDDPQIISQALEFAVADSCIYVGMPDGDACEKIYQLLLKHGAVFKVPQECEGSLA